MSTLKLSKDKLRLLRSQGFTLVELVIVIVVIAILAAIVIVAYNGIQNRAHDSVTTTNINQVVKGLEAMYIDTGQYYYVPSSTSSRQACVGLAPDGANDCGFVTATGPNCASLGITEGTSAVTHITYSDDFNQELKEFLGTIPKGVQSQSWSQRQATDGCEAIAEYKGAIYQGAKQIDIYRNSEGVIGGTVHHRPESSTAPTGKGAFSITYPTNDGECRVSGSQILSKKGSTSLGAWTFSTDRDVCIVLRGDVRFFTT